ncbi:MAG: M23 family metallopeptidase [Clostridia bacterium]|nr:M23 family metallopeptidase [Clostridia bacterium]
MNAQKQTKCTFSSYVDGGERGERRVYEMRGGVARAARSGNRKRRTGFFPQAGYFIMLMLAILGFSLVFALKLASGDEAVATFNVMLGAAGDETVDETGDEQLGRLRFVQFPGLLTVFAPSDSPVMPIKSEQSIVDDSLTARIYATPGTEAVSALDGTVRAIDEYGTGEAFYKGGSVTVAHSDGVEITYYGLAPISVERGQPVLQRTVLGLLAGDTLFIRVTRNGRPVDPLEFLGVKARIG